MDCFSYETLEMWLAEAQSLTEYSMRNGIYGTQAHSIKKEKTTFNGSDLYDVAEYA